MNEKPNERDNVRRIGRDGVRTYERARDPLTVDRQVKVRRSDGTIETDWKIRKFMDKGSMAVVRKLDDSIEKTLTTRELEELNPPEK